MLYRIFHPVPILSDVVEHYWYADIALTEPTEQHYATPLIQGLAFNFKQQTEHHTYHDKTLTLGKSAYIFGQPVCPRIITTNDHGINLLGVRFKPLGIAKITGINMSHIADEIIPAEEIWGNEIELLCDEMQSAASIEKSIEVLESFLIKKYLTTTLHYRVDNAYNAIKLIVKSQGSIDIKTLKEETNTTRKTLERAFMNYLGVHPKIYAPIVRFNAAKNILDHTMIDSSLSTIALDYGFYDCSHFISEFKTFAGITPQGYLKTTPLNLVVKDH